MERVWGVYFFRRWTRSSKRRISPSTLRPPSTGRPVLHPGGLLSTWLSTKGVPFKVKWTWKLPLASQIAGDVPPHGHVAPSIVLPRESERATGFWKKSFLERASPAWSDLSFGDMCF